MSDRTDSPRKGFDSISRRRMLRNAAGFAAAGAAVSVGRSTPAGAAESNDTAGGKAVTKGNINQSIIQWCFGSFGEEWSVERTARAAAELGCKSVELVDPEHWPTLKEHGLVCAITGSHGFTDGVNDPANWDRCLELMHTRIDQCAEAGFPNVITFTGMRQPGLSDEEGAANCVEAYKKVVGHAEDKGVNLCLEMLNSRVDVTMKGHPGYQGDHTDYCADIIRRVGSPNLKLLFDIYHVQIMDGDIIRRIHENKDVIGHIHTAGNPGRNELDQTQEIYYPPTMQALLEIGYEGYVGQEFIPTIDPMKGLRQAVKLCDV